MHSARDMQLGNSVMCDLEIDQHLGNHADHPAVRGQGSLSDGLHQPDVRAAINKPDIACSKCLSQFLGRSLINRVRAVGRGAEHSNVTNHRNENNKRSSGSRKLWLEVKGRSSVHGTIDLTKGKELRTCR